MKKLKFNKENQRLIEQGLKTHTCRPLKPQPKLHQGFIGKIHTVYDENGKTIECPYGAEGDRIPLYEENGETIFTHATIESIKVKRIQDIAKREYLDEGAAWFMFKEEFTGIPDSERCKDGEDYKLIFKQLWNSIYGPDAWDRNDYCWFIKFKPEDFEHDTR